jgi:hypothetical protein
MANQKTRLRRIFSRRGVPAFFLLIIPIIQKAIEQWDFGQSVVSKIGSATPVLEEFGEFIGTTWGTWTLGVAILSSLLVAITVPDDQTQDQSRHTPVARWKAHPAISGTVVAVLVGLGGFAIWKSQLLPPVVRKVLIIPFPNSDRFPIPVEIRSEAGEIIAVDITTWILQAEYEGNNFEIGGINKGISYIPSIDQNHASQVEVGVGVGSAKSFRITSAVFAITAEFGLAEHVKQRFLVSETFYFIRDPVNGKSRWDINRIVRSRIGRR